MLSILIRFQKELVALVGDASQMYHQLVLTLEDRPLQSNLDYPDLDYPDYSIIRTLFSDPNFFMNIN